MLSTLPYETDIPNWNSISTRSLSACLRMHQQSQIHRDVCLLVVYMVDRICGILPTACTEVEHQELRRTCIYSWAVLTYFQLVLSEPLNVVFVFNMSCQTMVAVLVRLIASSSHAGEISWLKASSTYWPCLCASKSGTYLILWFFSLVE